MGVLGDVLDQLDAHVAHHQENDPRFVNALKHVKRRTDALYDAVRQLVVLVAIEGAICVLLLVAVALGTKP